METIAVYLKGSLAGGVSRLVFYLAAFASLYLLNQIISPQEYGSFVLAEAVIAIVIPMASLGLPVLVLFRVSSSADFEQLQKGRKIAGTALCIILVLASGAACLLWIVAESVAGILNNPSAAFWLKALAIIVPLTAVSDLHFHWYQATKRLFQAIIILEVVRPITWVVGLLILWIFFPQKVLIAWVLALSIGVVLIYFIWKEGLLKYVSFQSLRMDDFKYSGYVVGSMFVFMAMFKLDILMVSYFLGELSTAHYNIALQFALIVTAGREILGRIFEPRVSSYIARQDLGGLRKEYYSIANVTTVLSLLMAVVLVVVSPYFLRLIGPYEKAFGVLLVLAGGRLIASSMGTVEPLLKMTGHSKVIFLNSTATLLINAVGNYLLIPVYGIMGAGIATAGAYVIRNILDAIYVFRQFHFHVYSFRRFLFACSMLVVMAVMIFNGSLGGM